MQRTSSTVGLLFFIACSLLPFSSEAAVPLSNNSLPSTLIPNQQEKNLRELPTPLSKPLLQRITPRIIPQVQIDETNQQDAFVLRKVIVKGNTAITTAALEKYYALLLGKKITKQQILNVAQSLTQYYQSEGYILSFAQTYLLDTTQGIAGIEIIERALTTVKLEGVEALTKLPIVAETQKRILAII
jgi:hemolysin activation/secretion protein